MKIRRIDFYPTDWLEGTIELTHIERSVYITICAAIYARGGPVPVEHVRKFCPGHGFKQGFDGLVRKGKVDAIRTENGLTVDQRRTASELARARHRTEQAVTNGAKGGRPNGLEKPGGFSVRARVSNKQQTSINIQQEEDSSPLDSPPLVPEIPAEPEPKKQKKPPAVPLEQWEPSPAHQQQALLAGHDDAWLADQADTYRDWLANAKTPHRDREAGFRNWIRRNRFEAKPNGQTNGHHRKSAVEKLYEGGFRAALAWEERERARLKANGSLLDS